MGSSAVTDWITACASVLAAGGTIWAVWEAVRTAKRSERARQAAEDRTAELERTTARRDLEREITGLRRSVKIADGNLQQAHLLIAMGTNAFEVAVRRAHDVQLLAAAERRLAEEFGVPEHDEEPPSPPHKKG